MKAPAKVLVLALAAVAYFPVYGTLVPRLSFEELVGQSEAVAHGRVVSVNVAWDGDHAAIWTSYEIRVDEALKGSPGATLTLREPGGEVDGTVMEVVGAPRYERGEEVVVFVSRTPNGLRTCGWGQGRFVVEGEPGGRRARHDVGAIQLTAPRGARAGAPAMAAPDEALTAFKQRIRAEVSRQQGAGTATER